MSESRDIQIGSPGWLDLMIDGAARLGVTVTRAQAEQFAIHGQSLVQWNRKINLTAITDPLQMAAKHFLDAIAPLQQLPAEGHLLDIGTGGGFPGLPLKIMAPGLSMTLIDGVRKKVNFVKAVVRRLNLKEIEALHIRCEELARDSSRREHYEIIVSRAVAQIEPLVRLAAPLLAPNGRIILYQGPRQTDGSAGPPDSSGITLDRRSFTKTTLTYNLPFVGDARAITILQSS